MTDTLFAATHREEPPRPTLPPAYRPGVCNIGPAEVARRRWAGHIGLVATLLVFATLVAIDAPPPLRLILFVPAAGAASGYLQAWLKFCAGFGALGVFNFGQVGGTQPVADPEARKRDRRRANQIGLTSLLIGVAVAVAAFLLPL